MVAMIRRHFLATSVAFAVPASIPATGANASGQATTDLLAEAEALNGLRAVALWQDGAEVAALGYHGWTPDRPTNIKSASKSVVSALAGIAIARGFLDGADQPIAPILRDDLPTNPDPRLFQITLGNLLSMQAGLERQSGANYGRWVSSRNWVRAALAAPFTQDPGGRMQYSTASTHLISAVLTKVTGRPTRDLADDWLEALPGFQITGWDRDPQGIYLGGNQMAMSARSLMAFGTLYANRGLVGDQRIIPEAWIDESWQRRTSSIFGGTGYGYGWFLARLGGRDVRYGWGYGGQMVYVFPRIRRQPAAVIAMTSDPDRPSARTGYRDALHRLAGGLVQAL